MRKTKIVCTLGPAVDSRDKIAQLMRAGMNVARLNCSHGDWETREKWMRWIRELSPSVAPVAILVDLQGPKFRIGDLPETARHVRPREHLTVGPAEADIPIHQPEILAALQQGSQLLLGDGNVALRILEPLGTNFHARALTGGEVRSRQGVTVVGRQFDTPPITDKDREDARRAVELGADYLALSYVRRGTDIADLRALVGNADIGIMAKIETRQAVERIDEIVREADALMVARGDMGLQMSIEEVPHAQKQIIAVCERAGKPVVTATQMLESMLEASRPTRAEASDVANAILDGTDAVMLSGETATGRYPIEAVRWMARIAGRTEKHYDNEPLLRDFERRARKGVRRTEAVAHAVAELAEQIRPRAILTTSTSGQTARLVSKFRPDVPVLCATWRHSTRARLALVWGVTAIQIPLPRSTDEIVGHAMRGFLECRILREGDLVVVTAGVPAGSPGHTNLMLVHPVTSQYEYETPR